MIFDAGTVRQIDLKYRTVMKACLFLSLVVGANGFMLPKTLQSNISMLKAVNKEYMLNDNTRRQILQQGLVFIPALVLAPQTSIAGSFTPGGTLVDRDIGVTVGNSEASPSRKVDNSNVLFTQDNYFKFGVAAPWIEPDSTDFPKTMPFVLSQQRYDALKKYGDRVKAGAQAVNRLDDAIKAGRYASIGNGDDAPYALRPFGLLANGFLGSENTGTTNELLLARWYINEIYLRVGDIGSASSEAAALEAHCAAKKSINSYFAMLNRVITSKVGNKFEYL